MGTRILSLIGALVVTLGSLSRAALPEPPKEMSPWAMPWGHDVPGVVSADALIDKPAGKDGPVEVRDGHFYSGNHRVRFWGFSIAFSGAFPTHGQADDVARRLARFGVNAIRFHHIDNQPYPNGIFSDKTLETLSPEALNRLDYFIAALKSQGIYSDLNLHVSRWWSKAHHWANADKLPEYDKMVDLFEPRLIAAQKQYARDLLTHVNPYTRTRYADEPAVCVLEINNENTLFLWGGEQKLAELPEPYGAELTKLWNDWLLKKYGSRAAMASAWSAGAQPAGPNLLKPFEAKPIAWHIEQHESAKAGVALEPGAKRPGLRVDVTASDGTGWHVQLSQPGLKVVSGRAYSLSFDARADEPTTIDAALSQAHAPWHPLGAEFPVQLGREWKHYHFGVYCTADDDNARISFQLGGKVDTIGLSHVAFTEGGQQTLAADEDPARDNVQRGYPDQGFTPARLHDWYDFLQQTDQAYFTKMRQFLKHDLGVKCPVTGTIGLGPLGTLSQSHMDFVDAHAYWDHPQFPHRPWDGSDWREKNEPMVDDPAGATLWQLAATRVAGKPFTVTEYNHAAPNEWQAECVPIIASYAALQDWDGVFLFDYVASNHHYREMDRMRNYFDVEGNPQKMDVMPFGARLFLGGQIKPLTGEKVVSASGPQMLEAGSKYYYTLWPFVRDELHVSWQDALGCRLGLTFDPRMGRAACVPDPRVSWSSSGIDTGTGRFIVRHPNSAVFVGFASGPMPVDLGAVRIEKLDTPFASIIVTPATAGESIENAKRLLVSAVARGGNAGMEWDAARHTVSNRWGHAPPLVEVVRGTLSLPTSRAVTALALKPDGTRGNPIPVRTEHGRATFDLGAASTLWYELDRN